MQEHELVDLLAQYEHQDHCSGDSPLRPPTSHYYRPLSVAADTHSSMDTMHSVMAARMAEEEQAQRVMMALNDTKPSYPLKTQEEVSRVLEEVRRNAISLHSPSYDTYIEKCLVCML